MDFLFVRLTPDDLEERFRHEHLSRDKTQITIVMAITLFLLLGFIAMDLHWIQQDNALTITIVSRCVTSVASLVAIWLVNRTSSIKSFDRIIFGWILIDILHLLIVNAVRPTDYLSVVAWDLLSIFGIYFFAPFPYHYQLMSAFLLTGSSIAIWVITRIPLTGGYETLAVLGAYVISNIYGVFLSRQRNKSRRNQFMLLLQEAELRADLSDRAIELEDAKEQLEHLVMTDSLTGINNRRFFMQLISEEVERSKRYRHPFSLLALDIDNFKEINDTYGHDIGDEVLRLFAQQCHTSLRATDKLARLGGDEFIALLVQTDQNEARVIAERLRESIEEMDVQVKTEAINISVSVGITSSEDGLTTVEELLRGVDTALYKAKNRGRNQVATFQEN
jgi:diguanylate cyclase (GGDEF)-like protein